jgi:Peptidase family M41/ATPase family associated with various cellular activities (AAA)
MAEKMKLDLKQIEERKKKLDEVKVELKKHFIGIDHIVESLLDYLQVWYLVPEILTRPIIINLWGMTGVGKTDLIRKMIKLLNFQDRFAEVELSNIDSTSYVSSVSDVLERNGINDGKPSVVLFDEIQRFNTLDTDGKPMPQSKFTDFWELLSDGRLSKKQKDDFDYYLSSYMYNQKDIAKRKLKGEEGLDENPMIDSWQAQSLKRMLNMDTDIMDMSEISQKDMIEMIMKAKTKKAIYEPIDHSKTLIIISGNLDEAFNMANQTSEADVDADIFHAYTKKITLVDIKNALSRKFRPEQVARFGNIHLIYHSLRKRDFEKLIAREIKRIITATYDRFDVKLSVANTINDLIFRNGVFPVQGVRPVFSSVIDILESNLSKLIYTAITTKAKTVTIDYNAAKSLIEATIGKKSILMPYVGRIDEIRDGNVADAVANISVHECGHAVLYMHLFNLVPLQLKSKIASSYAGGFTFPHMLHETKENLINKIKIYLAGGIAEEIVFGKGNASIGRIHDREQATSLAIDYVRKYGFDEEFQANYALDFAYTMDKSVTDVDVEKMIARLVSETKELLSAHQPLLHELSIELANKGSMDAKDISVISKKYGVNALIKEEGFLNIAGYNNSLRKKG